MRLSILALALTIGLGAPRSSLAQFQALETPTMRMVYTSPLQAYLVPQVSATLENALRFHRKLFSYDPGGQINVMMHDLWHLGNAGARPVPENHVTIGIAPYGHDYESAPAPERMASSMNHELAHIVTTDKATAADQRFRRLFAGKVTPNAEQPLSIAYSYLTTPRWYAPRWYLEGIATYMETWMNGGLGRALGPYDEMVFRTLVRDSLTMYDVVGLESEGTTVDFQVGSNSYLYGTRFVSYLALTYGNDSLLAWFDRTEGSRRYFSRQFAEVFGRPLTTEWQRWLDWERGWQRQNLAAVRRHPTTPARPLTDRVLGSSSRAFYDQTTGDLLVAIRYPGQEAQIVSIDVATGAFTRISNLIGATGLSVTALAFDPEGRTLYYTSNNADWRHLRALDLATGRSTTLLRDARIGDLAFNRADKSLWGVRHDNGLSTLVTLAPPYTAWKQVWTLPYGRDLFDLDFSPDGRALIGSLSEVSGDQRLVRFDVAALRRGATDPEVLYEFGEWAPSTFVYAPDGKTLFGSSYFTGVSNIFRYDLATKQMVALSNAETGFFKPVPLTSDSLVVLAYSGTGFVPSMIANQAVDSVSAIQFLGNVIAEQRPDVQEWMPPAPDPEDAAALAKATGPYTARRHFKLDNAYPVLEGYQDAAGTNAVAAGVRLNFSDRLGATGLEVTGSYSPDARLAADERLHLRAVFRHWNWKLSAVLNRADFYDLFGPTKVSRRGYGLVAQYGDNLYLDGPTSLGYTIQAARYGDLAILPEFQNVATAFRELTSVAADLNYRSLRRSLGAIDDELGSSATLALRGNAVNGGFYPRLSLDAARGILLPIDHSALWFRASAGQSLASNRDQSFARFYFGGFANNWVESRAAKQFRAAESFPGLEINQVSGANFVRGQVEWMLPPFRFRDVGIPSAYLRWAGLSLFATGLVTDLDEAAQRRTVQSLGSQLDVRLITLSHLESTLSLGYALAKGEGIPWRRALMVSLKLM